jgi:alginate O-acetyltransferase complex protein AlgI
MFAVMIGWFIFSYNEIAGRMGYLAAMFGGGGRFLDNGSIYQLYSNAVLLAVLILGSTSLPAALAKRVLGALRGADRTVLVLRGAYVVVIFLASTAYLVSASYNPFLYFRF